MPLSHLLFLNFAVALYLTGVIWVVQLVVYPALALVGKSEFARYHAAHTRGMGWVVGAPMLLELGLAGWLAWAFGARARRWASWRWCCSSGPSHFLFPYRFTTG
jgi:hypothetical protein